MTFSPEIRAFCMPTPCVKWKKHGKVKPSKYIIPKTELKLCYNVEKGSLKKTGEK